MQPITGSNFGGLALLRTSPDVFLYDAIRSTFPKLDAYRVFDIMREYKHPWRQYHNGDHILKMYGLTRPGFIGRPLNTKNLRALQAMIIFHDIVYKLDREKGWNETESANFARQCMTSYGEAETFIDVVCNGILATINHTLSGVPAKHRKVVAWLIDIDLFAGIGDTWDEFRVNTINIGLEYGPRFTNHEYEIGRKQWAEGMLAHERIYLTEYFGQYEAKAREFLTIVKEGI